MNPLFEGKFDELEFFARIKSRPCLFLGRKSLVLLDSFLTGMEFGFYYSGKGECLPYFRKFTDWYFETVVRDKNGYAGWLNHMLYTSAYHDDMAFDCFFSKFERYLADTHGASLPRAEEPGYKGKLE